MGRSVDKIPLIVAVFEQNIFNSQRSLDFAVAGKDWVKAIISQCKIETATELLEVVKALGIKVEKKYEKDNV